MEAIEKEKPYTRRGCYIASDGRAFTDEYACIAYNYRCGYGVEWLHGEIERIHRELQRMKSLHRDGLPRAQYNYMTARAIYKLHMRGMIDNGIKCWMQKDKSHRLDRCRNSIINLLKDMVEHYQYCLITAHNRYNSMREQYRRLNDIIQCRYTFNTVDYSIKFCD